MHREIIAHSAGLLHSSLAFIESIDRYFALSLSLTHTHIHTELEGRLIATGHTGEGLGRSLRKWSLTLEHTRGRVCATFVLVFLTSPSDQVDTPHVHT